MNTMTVRRADGGQTFMEKMPLARALNAAKAVRAGETALRVPAEETLSLLRRYVVSSSRCLRDAQARKGPLSILPTVGTRVGEPRNASDAAYPTTFTLPLAILYDDNSGRLVNMPPRSESRTDRVNIDD